MRRALLWLLLAALVLPALAVTGARLVQPRGALGVQLVSFAPVAVLPYLVALVVLLAVLWRARRRLPVLLAAVAVAGLVALHGWWLAPLFTGPTPAPSPDADPVTVMNANSLQGRIDAIGLVQAAADRRVDVLVVEEITTHQLATMESAGLAEGWPYRLGEPGAGVSRTMVFSRFPLADGERLDTTFDGWAVTVATPTGDLRLLAVHPSPPTDPDRWRADLAVVARAAGDADLVVGDLNATLDHGPLREILDTGLRDAAELANAGWQPTWPHEGEFRPAGIPLPPFVAIDHVLLGSDMTALWARTVVVPGSDHAALVAQVAAR